MASKVVGGITPTPHMGVIRVLTSDFLQLRRNALRAQRSASDSEDVRWVCCTNVALDRKEKVGYQLECVALEIRISESIGGLGLGR